MPTMKRTKTKYEGVTYIEGTGTDGKPEKIFYIRFRRDGKLIEEKAGRERKDDMTASRASRIRGRKIEGEPSRKEVREAKKSEAEAVANRWTFDRLWELYREQNASGRSAKDDRSRYENYIRPAFGTREPSTLVPLDLDRMKKKIEKSKDHRFADEGKHKGTKGKTPATVKNILELLRRLSNFAEKKRLCPGLPFRVSMPKVNNEKTENLTPEQMARLLQVLDTFDDRLVADMMRLALTTGMRKMEIFRLRWVDVDSRRGFLTIKTPKGGTDQTIPLTDAAREIISRQPKADSPFVFPGKGGRQRVDAKKAVNRIKAEAGLPAEFRAFHGLRHAFASALASSGEVDLYTLQRLLTHKSPTMTQRYAHLSDAALRRGASVMSRIVAEAQEKAKAEEGGGE